MGMSGSGDYTGTSISGQVKCSIKRSCNNGCAVKNGANRGKDNGTPILTDPAATEYETFFDEFGTGYYCGGGYG